MHVGHSFATSPFASPVVDALVVQFGWPHWEGAVHGIGATLTGSLEPGEIVTLDIPLPLTPYPIRVRAIVRYRQGLRYGFEFLTLNDNQRDTIRRVCEYLATKS